MLETTVYLLTVRNQQPALWRLGFHGKNEASFQGSAQIVWERARLVVEKHSQWVAFRGVPAPVVQHINGCVTQGLDGESFGLSFALAIYAQAAGIALPLDFVASAQIKENGVLDGVDGLAAKIFIAEKQPGVTRLFVASKDQKIARKFSKRLEIVGFETFNEVIEYLGLVPPVEMEATGRALLLSLIGAALGTPSGRTPGKLLALERGAELILSQSWLSSEDRFVADACRRASRRHLDILHGPPELLDVAPLKAAMERIPQPLKATLLSNLLRESYDTGLPTFNDIRPIISPLLKTGLDAFPGEIQLASAFSQCLWISGEVAEAFELGESCIGAWKVRQTPQDASYALTHVFQCAWLIPELLARAEQLYQANHIHNPFASIYYELARARAYGFRNPEDGRRILEDIQPQLSLHWRYLRMSWQRLARQFGMDVEMEQPQEPIKIEAALLKLDQIQALRNKGNEQEAEHEARHYFLESPGVRQAILLNHYHQPTHFAPFILTAFPY